MHHVNILAGTGDGTAEHFIVQTNLVVWTDEEKLICRDSNSVTIIQMSVSPEPSWSAFLP